MQERLRNKKARAATGFFVTRCNQCQLRMDSIYRARVNTCTAIDTGIGVDSTFSSLLADRVNRTGILTCRTICAIISNSMGHNFTSLLD